MKVGTKPCEVSSMSIYFFFTSGGDFSIRETVHTNARISLAGKGTFSMQPWKSAELGDRYVLYTH